ncbi:MAG: hypothetical protein ACRC77_00075 [Bacteroidales bacterium]
MSSHTIPFFCRDMLTPLLRQTEHHEIFITPGHSFIEKEFMQILLEEKEPFIWVLARGIPDKLADSVENAVRENRILIVSPFPTDHVLITGHRAMLRNRWIIEISHKLIIGYINKYGSLNELIEDKSYTLLFK